MERAENQAGLAPERKTAALNIEGGYFAIVAVFLLSAGVGDLRTCSLPKIATFFGGLYSLLFQVQLTDGVSSGYLFFVNLQLRRCPTSPAVGMHIRWESSKGIPGILGHFSKHNFFLRYPSLFSVEWVSLWGGPFYGTSRARG